MANVDDKSAAAGDDFVRRRKFVARDVHEAMGQANTVPPTAGTTTGASRATRVNHEHKRAPRVQLNDRGKASPSDALARPRSLEGKGEGPLAQGRKRQRASNATLVTQEAMTHR